VTACANESIKKSSIVVDYSKLDLNDIKIPKMITVAEIKPTVLLTDELDKPETRPDSPKKNVQFGNSWKGTLEMKGSSSIRVPPKSIRASLNDDTFKAPSKPAPFGKLLIKSTLNH
jgi:hypothetical protein